MKIYIIIALLFAGSIALAMDDKSVISNNSCKQREASNDKKRKILEHNQVENVKPNETQSKSRKRALTKKGKKRKITRRKAIGEAIPTFNIENEIYLSAFDIRCFLSEISKNDDDNDLKYEFRKIEQKLSRKYPGQRKVFRQKSIAASLKDHMRHINPNSKTVFIKLIEIEKGMFNYLIKKHKMPINNDIIIPVQPIDKIEIIKKNAMPDDKAEKFQVHKNSEDSDSIIDVSFEPSYSDWIDAVINPLRGNSYNIICKDLDKI